MYTAKVKNSVEPLKDVSNKITDNDLEMTNIFNLQLFQYIQMKILPNS